MARTKTAPPAPAMKLRDEEIQALADAAWKAWESGSEHATTDRVGGVWRFRPLRDGEARLEIERSDSEGVGLAKFTGAELGVDEVRAMLASRILALVAPALARVNSGPPAPL